MRITIELDNEVPFHEERINDPSRVFVDLPGTRAAPTLVDQTIRFAQINGEPGVVSYLDGHPYSVLTLDAAGDRIQAIYIVTNPEKLAHLAPLPVQPC